MKYEIERLSWWDRIFNRHKLVFIETREETWKRTLYNIESLTYRYKREVAVYHKVDRLTGCYEIVLKYLN